MTAEYLNQLEELRNQLALLEGQARDLVHQHDPDAYDRLDAYQAFSFGHSDNSYDTTFVAYLDCLTGS